MNSLLAEVNYVSAFFVMAIGREHVLSQFPSPTHYISPVITFSRPLTNLPLLEKVYISEIRSFHVSVVFLFSS